MKPTGHPLWRFLGFNTQGDLGPVTMYTSRDHGLIFFLATTPKKPQSARQRHQRNLFRSVGEAWSRLSPIERNKWHAAAAAAGLRIHGFDAFAYVMLKGDSAWYATLSRAAGFAPPLTPSTP